MVKTDSLKVATGHYYWKLEHSLVRAFELEEYERARIYLEHPILDLGCGDGAFCAMLLEKGLLDRADIALDCSPEIWRRDAGAHEAVFQGDARIISLGNGSVRSVFANGVLSSIPTDQESDIERILSEVHRVLADDGLFVMTAPTPRFNQNLTLPKVFKKVGLAGLGERYMRGFDRRVAHYLVFAEDQWVQKLAAHHFRVEQVGYYCTPYQEGWYEFFALPPFWLVKGLKPTRKTVIRPVARRLVEGLLRPVFARDQGQDHRSQSEQAGYLLIVARRASSF